MSAPVHLLIATVPARRASVEHLIDQLQRQSRPPDTIHLRLDGYGDEPSPWYASSRHVREYRAPGGCRGPGTRWREVEDFPRNAVLVVLDDDQVLGQPDVVERLACAVEIGGAAAHVGTDFAGFGGVHPAETPLVAMGAASMVVRVDDLAGLQTTYEEVRRLVDFDPFGDMGDDEAVVALHLWRRHVFMRATGPLGIREAPGSQTVSQTVKRREHQRGRSFFWQREAIAKVTGWPWVSIGA